MKTKIIILVFYIFACNGLKSQETIEVKFNEADPIWVHTLEDSTFIPIPGQPYITRFSSVKPHIIHRDGSHLYIMGVCMSKNDNADHGFILNKLDLETGHKIWTHYNTPNNSGDKDLYQTISSNNSKLEIVGAIESENGKINVSHKIIDGSSGVLQKKSKSITTIPTIYLRYFTGHVLEPDSILINAYTIGEGQETSENFSYNYGLNVEVYNKEMHQIRKIRKLFDFSELGPFSIDQPNFSLMLNEKTIVSLAYKDRYESWENLGSKIMWTDISDPNNIVLKQIKDYKDVIPGTKEGFLLHKFESINNTIYLSHLYPNFSIQKNTCYILWLDANGEIISFIPITSHGNHVYQYADMFYANNSFAYLFAFPSTTGKQGFDIIRINSGSDTIQFVSSLTVKNEGEEFGTQINSLFDDGYLVFGGLTKKINNGTKTSSKYYCFKASDLGINLETVLVEDLKNTVEDISIFPNPSSNTLYLKVPSTNKSLKVTISDTFGNVVLIDNINQGINQIDVKNLSNGVYFVNVSNVNGMKIGKTEKFVKIE